MQAVVPAAAKVRSLPPDPSFPATQFVSQKTAIGLGADFRRVSHKRQLWAETAYLRGRRSNCSQPEAQALSPMESS